MIVLFIFFVLLAFFASKITNLLFNDDPEIAKKTGFIIRWVAVGLAVLVLFFSTVVIITAGHVGVIKRLGAVTRTIEPGLNVKTPFAEDVEILDTRVQKEETEADAASKDLQTVKAKVALNYRIQPNRAGDIVQQMGKEYKERVIDPAIQESVKASTSGFTAEELITKREAVREVIKIHLKNKLEFRGIIVDEFNIVNFDFSPSFNKAIEDKVTAEQNALAAKNKLEQIKFEAQQSIESAKGKAEAIRIEADALRANPQLLELRSIEKWDGKLPTFMGQGAVPFVNINP